MSEGKRELSPDKAAGKINLLISIHTKTSKVKHLQTKGEVREPVEGGGEPQAGRGQSRDISVPCSSTVTSWEGCGWDRVAGGSSKSLACG